LENVKGRVRGMGNWKDNIRMDLRKIGWELWTGFIWLRLGTTIMNL
jgi:hypothetical protein